MCVLMLHRDIGPTYVGKGTHAHTHCILRYLTSDEFADALMTRKEGGGVTKPVERLCRYATAGFW